MTPELNEINLSDYEIILKVKKGRFTLSIPDMLLTASGNSLEQVYQLLTEKKEAFLKELQEAGLTLPKQEPVSITGAGSPQKFTASSLIDNVLGFMMKVAIIGVIVTFTVAIASSKLGKIAEIQTTKVTKAIDKVLVKLDKKSSKTLKKLETITYKPGRRVEKELLRAANKKIDPERQERIVKSIRTLVKRWKPVVKEIRPLFEE